jgi:Dolichyl-phosphate-mannose-protein mannosyltransferase
MGMSFEVSSVDQSPIVVSLKSTILAVHHRSAVLALSGILLLVFLAGWRLAWDVPPYSKPLEMLHIQVIDVMKATRQLPRIKPHDYWQEFHQPPLYYLAVAILSAFDPPVPNRINRPANPYYLGTVIGNRNAYVPDDQPTTTLAIGRLVSLACVAIAVVATYLQARFLLAGGLAMLAALVIGMQPQVLFIGTTLSNDAAAMGAVALALWWLTRLMYNGLTRRRAIVLGLLLGIAVLCKVNALLACSTVPFLLWHNRMLGASRLASYGLLVAAGIATIAGPWMLHNYVNYGDALAVGYVFSGPVSVGSFQYLLTPLPDMWKSFWLDYSAGLAGYAPDPYYTVVAVMLVAAAAGLSITWRRCPAQRPILAMHTSLVLLTIVASVWQKAQSYIVYVNMVPTAEGRHLFVAVPSLAIILAAALQAVRPSRLFMKAFTVLLVGNVVWAAGPHLEQIYGLPPLVNLNPPPPLDKPFLFANGMELRAARLSPGTTGKGDGWWVELEWTAQRPVDRNLSVSAQLLEWKDGTPINRGQEDSYPGNGLQPTQQWKPGITVHDQYFVPGTVGDQIGIFVYDRTTGQTVPTIAGGVALLPLPKRSP